MLLHKDFLFFKNDIYQRNSVSDIDNTITIDISSFMVIRRPNIWWREVIFQDDVNNSNHISDIDNTIPIHITDYCNRKRSLKGYLIKISTIDTSFHLVDFTCFETINSQVGSAIRCVIIYVMSGFWRNRQITIISNCAFIYI